VIPDDNHNGHDASLAKADAFIKTALAPVFAGPDWATGNLAIIITADEDNKSSGQHILTVVVHPSQEGRGKVDTPRLDQYSLHETLARVANVTPLGTRWKDNPDFAAAFNLPVWKDPEVVTPAG
jgi:acid phosphatase